MAEVRTVAVIGAGIMGRGIAHAAALGGYRTILEDILPTALRKAESEIRTNLDKAVEEGKVTKGDADQASAVWNTPRRSSRLRAKPIWSSRPFPRRWNRRSRSSRCSTKFAGRQQFSPPFRGHRTWRRTRD